MEHEKEFLDPYEQRLIMLNNLANRAMELEEKFKLQGFSDKVARGMALSTAFAKKYTGSARGADMIAVSRLLKTRQKEKKIQEKAGKVVRKSHKDDKELAEQALNRRWDIEKEGPDSF